MESFEVEVPEEIPSWLWAGTRVSSTAGFKLTHNPPLLPPEEEYNLNRHNDITIPPTSLRSFEFYSAEQVLVDIKSSRDIEALDLHLDPPSRVGTLTSTPVEMK